MSYENPIAITKMVHEIVALLSNNLPNIESKLEKFVDAFNRKFPNTNANNRGSAEAITWALMDTPLVLYALNLNGSMVIELHGILEKFAVRETINHLTTPASRKIASALLERNSLHDVAGVLQQLGIFDKEDVKFTKKLTALRNGIAHKNPRNISKMLLSRKEISFLDIESAMNNFDCIPLIIGTIHLLVKMSQAKMNIAK
jgi:hypothetical protein